MTVDPRFERRLPDILDSLYLSGMPTYRKDLLQQVERTPQRPAWRFLERWIPMADIASRPAFAPRMPSRAVGMALIVLALLIALAVAVVGTRQAKLPAPFGPAANGFIPYVSGGELYVGDPVSGLTRLLVGRPGGDIGQPQTSPDGTRVAFLRVAENAGGADPVDIYVVRADGSSLQRINPAPLPDWRWVSWTPDGRSLAVIHPVEFSGDGCAMTFCFRNQLDLFDATGNGTVTKIAAVEGMSAIQFRPPNGDELLYRALVDGKWGLFSMGADGTNVRTIVPATVPAEMDMSFSGAVYSADGTKVFYEHGDAGGCCRLWVVNADGSDDHEFRPLGPAWDGNAVVSPDGTRIAYWHNANDGGPHGIAVVRTDGTGPVIETGPKLSGTAHWVWSPDSSKILMYPNEATVKAYLLDPDGGPWTNVPWASDADIDWQRVAP